MDRHEHNGLVEDDLFSFAFRPMLVGHPPYLHTIDYPRARGACMGLPPFQRPLLPACPGSNPPHEATSIVRWAKERGIDRIILVVV